MPKISMGKYLKNRSKRRSTRINTNSATKTVEILNKYFLENKYPYKVIDSVLSVYVTTFFVEPINSSQDVKLEGLIPDLNKLLGIDNIRLIPNALNTTYIGLQCPNPSQFDLSFEDCLNGVTIKNKLPIGVDTTNELISLNINELGNTIVVGGQNTRKTTFVKSLLTSLILTREANNTNIILDNSYYHDLSVFSKDCYLSNNIGQSLRNLITELDRRESLIKGSSFKKYNQTLIDNDKTPLPTLNVFINEYRSEYRDFIYNLFSRSSTLGINIILSSSTYIPEFGKFLSSCLIFKVDDLEASGLSRNKDALYLIGKGDALIMARALKREDPLRIVTPYISDKEIRRLVP